MTVARAGAVLGEMTVARPDRAWPRRIAAWLERELQFRVFDDLGAVVLVGGLLASVGWSVQLARWGNAPFIHATMLIAGVAGFLFARWRFHWLVGHAAALAGGFAVVFWQAAYRTDGANIVERTRAVWERFFLWIEAARTGGISTDLVPFTVMLLSVAWIVSYFSSWAVFRWRTPWLATALLGTAILINLSYRPGRYEQTLFVFVGVTMLLFAHLAHSSRIRRWQASGMRYPGETRRLNIQDGILMTLAVIVVATTAPLYEPRSGLLSDTVGAAMRAPARRLEEPTKRLLSGVKGRPRVLLQDFGTALPFLGTFRLSETPVMYVETAYPTLNAGHIYEVYSSSGWINGPTVDVRVERGREIQPTEGLAEQLLVTQSVSPEFNTVTAIPAVGSFSSDQVLRLDLLPSLQWVIGPTTTAGDLGIYVPDDVRAFVESVQARPVEARRRGVPIEQDIQERLPKTLEIQSLRVQNGRFASVTLGRPGAAAFDPVSADLPDGVFAGSTYTVRKMISKANDEQLAEAGTDYPLWVTDRYLQLPPTLPDRVRELSDRIVQRAGAATPWEKTVAVAGYLRSLSYSQQIRGPALGEDGVDYFLFETRLEPCPAESRLGTSCVPGEPKGYSQYFGSALAVLLRTQGVPARMVAGYALGDYLPEERRFVIRDADRHGWAQVYFPGYGWIDVEATPGYPVVRRGTTTEEYNSAGHIPPIAFSEFDEGFFEEDLSEFEALARLGLRERDLAVDAGPDARVYWAAGVGVFVLALALAAAVVWNFGMSALAPAERAYIKLTRLGWLAGMPRAPSQTSTEYGHRIDFFLPRTGGAAEVLARRYNACVYGPKATGGGSGADDSDELWRRVRGVLVKRALRRLLPFA
jgi:transglutaminase-like putative cysteine protease